MIFIIFSIQTCTKHVFMFQLPDSKYGKFDGCFHCITPPVLVGDVTYFPLLLQLDEIALLCQGLGQAMQ